MRSFPSPRRALAARVFCGRGALSRPGKTRIIMRVGHSGALKRPAGGAQARNRRAFYLFGGSHEEDLHHRHA